MYYKIHISSNNTIKCILQFNRFNSMFIYKHIFTLFYVRQFQCASVRNECVQSNSLLVLFLFIVAKCLIMILFNQQCLYSLYYP